MYVKNRRFIARNLVNVSGWRTERKIIVFESDDWGSIRMPSKKVYAEFLRLGIPVDKNPYCRYDSLATETDLEALFAVLMKYRDANNNHPVITANAVMANPDFEQIKATGYSTYIPEKFTATLERYPECQRSFLLWEKGMQEKVFHPQFHGREHLNVLYWLKLLQENHSLIRKAFEYGFWGLSNGILKDCDQNIQASFEDSSDEAVEFQKQSLIDGLSLFEELLGYRSESFIASNYIWSSELEKTLHEEGIHYIQGMKYQILPRTNGNGKRKVRRRTGEKNQFNQINLVRNCIFEPSLHADNIDNVGECLKDIQNAFFWKKPAVVTSHRLNFMGCIDPSNRSRNLAAFSGLLFRILKLWPEVEFLTSDQLGNTIENSHYS